MSSAPSSPRLSKPVCYAAAAGSSRIGSLRSEQEPVADNAWRVAARLDAISIATTQSNFGRTKWLYQTLLREHKFACSGVGLLLYLFTEPAEPQRDLRIAIGAYVGAVEADSLRWVMKLEREGLKVWRVTLEPAAAVTVMHIAAGRGVVSRRSAGSSALIKEWAWHAPACETLRKYAAWSQEELYDHLGVPRPHPET